VNHTTTRATVRRLGALRADQPGALALLLVGMGAGAAAFRLAELQGRPWLVLGAWAAGIAGFLAGAWLLDGRPAGQVAARVRAARTDVLVLGGLVAVALAARAVELGTVPRAFSGDEGEMGMEARAVLDGKVGEPFATGWLSHPRLWFLAQALSLRLFGDDVAGLRTLSALIGAATVPAVYLLGRVAWSRAVGLTAAALLAVYHVHVHFSRLGLNNVVDPLFVVLGFAALLHALRTGSRFAYAAAGVSLGVAQHFYMGARLAPLVVAAVLVYAVLAAPRRLWEQRTALPYAGLGFVLGFGPLLRFFLEHRADFNARLERVGLVQSGAWDERRAAGEGPWEIVGEQLRGAFGAFATVPDRSEFYGAGVPLLDPVSSVLLVAGLALALVRPPRAGGVLLLAWLVGGALLGGALLVDPPQTPKYVHAAPALCLGVALGLDAGRRLLARHASVGARAATVAVGAAVLALAAWNVRFYFGEYTPRGTYLGQRTEAATAIGRYVAGIPGRPYVYLFAAPATVMSNGSIRFLAHPLEGVDVLEPVAAARELPAPPPGRRPVYVFLPERSGELLVVRRAVPRGTLTIRRSPVDERRLFVGYLAAPR
jgi:hypothetical protein